MTARDIRPMTGADWRHLFDAIRRLQAAEQKVHAEAEGDSLDGFDDLRMALLDIGDVMPVVLRHFDLDGCKPPIFAEYCVPDSGAEVATTHQPLHVLEVDNSGVEIARFDHPVINGVAVDLLRVLVNERVTPGRAASMLRQLADTVERGGFLCRPGDQQTAEEHQGPPPGWNPADADELTLTMRGRVPDDFSGPDPFGEAQRREARLEAEGFRQWREREDAIADLVAVRRQQQGGGES